MNSTESKRNKPELIQNRDRNYVFMLVVVVVFTFIIFFSSKAAILLEASELRSLVSKESDCQSYNTLTFLC